MWHAHRTISVARSPTSSEEAILLVSVVRAVMRSVAIEGDTEKIKEKKPIKILNDEKIFNLL